MSASIIFKRIWQQSCLLCASTFHSFHTVWLTFIPLWLTVIPLSVCFVKKSADRMHHCQCHADKLWSETNGHTLLLSLICWAFFVDDADCLAYSFVTLVIVVWCYVQGSDCSQGHCSKKNNTFWYLGVVVREKSCRVLMMNQAPIIIWSLFYVFVRRLWLGIDKAYSLGVWNQ